MEAGRELDTEIATKVMGLTACPDWKIVNFGSAGGPALQSECSHAAGTCYSLVETGSMFGTVGGCPHYSTDIAAAWPVAEKLRETHGEVWIRSTESGWWNCRLAETGVNRSETTAPLAICLAALAVVEQ